MTDLIKRLKENEQITRLKQQASEFLSGNIYPALVALFVLVGHITALEFYFNIPIIISVCIGLFICPTIKPLLIVLTTFLYQIPFKHTPADFTYPFTPERDYYANPAMLTVIIILGALALLALMYRFFKYSLLHIGKNSPLFYPVVFLSVAFLLNGAFSEGYTVSNLFYSFSQIAIYFFLFYLLYYGLCDLSKKELIPYISYIAILNALVIVGELAFIYLTYDNLFVNGTIVKEAINFGWAVSNPAGFILTSLIPMIALGAINGKRPILCLIATVVTFGGAVLTLSRNAILFSSIALLVCLIYGCVRGDNRKLFRIFFAVCAICALIFGIVFFDKITQLLKNLLDMGANDNGRFVLWSHAIELFCKSPIFGAGFFGFGEIGTSTYIAILPTMAHNTLFILLSSMGIFGTACFIWYRVKLICPLLKNRTHEKNFLLITILLVMGMCMLDNHVFYIYTMFYFMIVQCASIRLCETDTPPSDKSDEA